MRASSLILATKMLSTTLYRACIIMESIMGRAMFSSSRFTGSVPMRFSALGVVRSFMLTFLLSKHTENSLTILLLYR